METFVPETTCIPTVPPRIIHTNDPVPDRLPPRRLPLRTNRLFRQARHHLRPTSPRRTLPLRPHPQQRTQNQPQHRSQNHHATRLGRPARSPPRHRTIIAAPSPSTATERSRLLKTELEELVVEAKKMGLTLKEVQDAVAQHWQRLTNKGDQSA